VASGDEGDREKQRELEYETRRRPFTLGPEAYEEC